MSNAQQREELMPNAIGGGQQSGVTDYRAADMILDYVSAKDSERNTLAALRVENQGLRAENATLRSRIHELEARVDELERALSRTRAYTDKLEQAYQELVLGFRRHVSDHVPTAQLELVLQSGVGDPPPPQSDPGSTSSGEDAEQQPTTNPAPPCPPPKPPQSKGRSEHGRSKFRRVPKITVDIIPPEVQLHGFSNYEQIGSEETSTVGYRRGGPIELVFRRPKYVPIAPQSGGTSGAVTGNTPEQTASESQGDITVVEHEVLMVPERTDFRSNPFVDGAIVRYYPEQQTSDDNASASVLIAPAPVRPIDKGLADASLIARIVLRKMDYHMPHYRQEIEFGRLGLDLSRANMSRWQLECGSIASRIADAMWSEALERPWFGMDATSTAIFDTPKYRKGHIFVLVAPGDSIVFRFEPNYNKQVVQELFGGYSGTVVADASANHNIIFGPGKATEAGCWAHAQRYLAKAFRGAENPLAATGLSYTKALFGVEQTIALLSPQERLRVRQEKSGPIVDQFFAWVDMQMPSVVEGSLMAAAFTYVTNQKEPLRRFLFDGQIPIHNNAAERALRKVVKGRANWLFCGSDEHAKAACGLYSLVASCQVHALEPEFYLQEVLTVAPSWPLSKVLQLSPKYWVGTRQRLIEQGRLKYIDLAQICGSRLRCRAN